MRIDSILDDVQLRDEMMDRLGGAGLPSGRTVGIRATDVRAMVERRTTEAFVPDIREAVIVRFGRPALLIRHDTFEPPDSEVWRQRLETARAAIETAIPAVGRIEVRNHPDLDWVGTGWLVAPDVVVTNRHVGVEFGRREGAGFAFRRNVRGLQIAARVDFREEHTIAEAEEFALIDILHIEDEDGPDMAFFRAAPQGTAGQLAAPIRLAERVPDDPNVVVVGYPAWDGRRNDPQVMADIFGDIYDVKRLQPGRLTAVDEYQVEHDCSTLGGNSGSLVLHLESGEAIGLHFGGRYEDSNYAVSAQVVADRLSRL